jgi:hypothetical protein
MQITQSQVHFTSQHHLEKSERQLTVIVEGGRLIDESIITSPLLNSPQSTDDAINHIDLDRFRISTTHELATPEINAEDVLDFQLLILKAFVEALTGKKIETGTIDTSSSGVSAGGSTTQVSTTASPPPQERLEVDLTLIKEYEYSDVTIGAQLTDSEGKQLTVNLRITMERRYEESSLQVLRREGIVTDPLVINFNGNAVQLSPHLIEFDLDSDGNAEQIASFASNSAYIALDKNGDGVINNGSELFGPNTGNGFQELAGYDEDGNGFIDENDSVFSKLLAFRPGQEQLISLQDYNITAIYIESVNSPFRLTDHQNQTLGEVLSTSFYIDSEGNAGSVQQIDLLT